MSEKEGINVLSAVRFMASDKRYMVRYSEPSVKMVENADGESTSRVGVDGVVWSKGTVVFE